MLCNGIVATVTFKNYVISNEPTGPTRAGVRRNLFEYTSRLCIAIMHSVKDFSLALSKHNPLKRVVSPHPYI
jgi:hypothetical protein